MVGAFHGRVPGWLVGHVSYAVFDSGGADGRPAPLDTQAEELRYRELSFRKLFP